MLVLALVFWVYRMEELAGKILYFMLPFSIGVVVGVSVGV